MGGNNGQVYHVNLNLNPATFSRGWGTGRASAYLPTSIMHSSSRTNSPKRSRPKYLPVDPGRGRGAGRG